MRKEFDEKLNPRTLRGILVHPRYLFCFVLLVCTNYIVCTQKLRQSIIKGETAYRNESISP